MYKVQLQLVLALIWAIDSAPLAIANWTHSPVQLTSGTILNQPFMNRQDACSTKSEFSCGTGILPVAKSSEFSCGTGILPVAKSEFSCGTGILPVAKSEFSCGTGILPVADNGVRCEIQQISKTTETPPDPNTTSGGGLDPSNSSCTKTKQPLTALIPQKNLGLTTAARPTFWFYIPYIREDIKRGEFVLLTQDEKTVIYETSFQLSQTPGIVSISIPLSSESALEESKIYRWFLRIYCNKSRNSHADLVVDASVKRVAMTAETERLINVASPDIWYDSLTRLGDALSTSPQDEKLKNDWNKLLESIGRKELSNEPLVGPVVELGG